MIYIKILKQRLIRIPYLDLPTATNANYWVIIPKNVLREIAIYMVISDSKLIIYVKLYKYD